MRAGNAVRGHDPRQSFLATGTYYRSLTKGASEFNCSRGRSSIKFPSALQRSGTGHMALLAFVK